MRRISQINPEKPVDLLQCAWWLGGLVAWWLGGFPQKLRLELAWKIDFGGEGEPVGTDSRKPSEESQ